MEYVIFLRRKREEYVVFGRYLILRSPDAEADTEKFLGIEAIDDISDTIVSGAGGRKRDTERSFLDIEVIMDDGDIFLGEFVIPKKALGRFSREVHVGLRFGEEDFMVLPLSFTEQGFETIGWFERGEAPGFLEKIKEEEPGIVSRMLIFFTGISEAEDEDHTRKR